MVAKNLTVSEIASLGSFSSARVRKAVSLKELRPRKHGANVYLGPTDAAFLTLCDHVKVPLQKQQKQRMYVWFTELNLSAPDPTPFQLNDAVQITIPEVVHRVWTHASKYARLKDELIVRDPHVQAGEPVVRGSRVSVYAIYGRLLRGDTLETLREDFPHLSRQEIEVANQYAEANPRRGRPSKQRSA